MTAILKHVQFIITTLCHCLYMVFDQKLVFVKDYIFLQVSFTTSAFLNKNVQVFFFIKHSFILCWLCPPKIRSVPCISLWVLYSLMIAISWSWTAQSIAEKSRYIWNLCQYTGWIYPFFEFLICGGKFLQEAISHTISKSFLSFH